LFFAGFVVLLLGVGSLPGIGRLGFYGPVCLLIGYGVFGLRRYGLFYFLF
jgi:hypothetical protein